MVCTNLLPIPIFIESWSYTRWWKSLPSNRLKIQSRSELPNLPNQISCHSSYYWMLTNIKYVLQMFWRSERKLDYIVGKSQLTKPDLTFSLMRRVLWDSLCSKVDKLSYKHKWALETIRSSLNCFKWSMKNSQCDDNGAIFGISNTNNTVIITHLGDFICKQSIYESVKDIPS